MYDMDVEKWITSCINLPKVEGEDLDWKLSVCLPNINVATARVFLRHNQFQEYPVKTTCNQREQTRYYTSILPYHPTQKVHVHSETVLGEYNKDNFTLACVKEHKDMTTLVPISKTHVEYGSVFKRNDLDVVLSIVEIMHEEEYGSLVQNKKACNFHILVTWPHNTPPTLLKKRLVKLTQLLGWFDF